MTKQRLHFTIYTMYLLLSIMYTSTHSTRVPFLLQAMNSVLICLTCLIGFIYYTNQILMLLINKEPNKASRLK